MSSTKSISESLLVDKSESQIIFTLENSSHSLGKHLTQLKRFFLFGGYQVSEERLINYSDDYFDTFDSFFQKSGHSLRVRRDHTGYTCIIKKPANSDLGIQTRHEVKISILDEEQLQSLTDDLFSEIIGQHLPSFVGLEFSHVLTVSNTRREFVASKEKQRLIVRFDTFSFELPNSNVKKSGQTELEIKVDEGEGEGEISFVRDSVLGVFPSFVHLHSSKFARAQTFLESYRTNYIYKASKAMQDHVYWVVFAAVIGVLGSFASIYSIFVN